jgi:DJ-1 family protein
LEIKVLIPIAHGTEEMEAVIIADILRRAGMNVKIAGETEIVTCSRGVKIIPDIIINKIEKDMEFDLIVLPGGNAGVQNLTDNDHLEDILANHKENGRHLAAICAAPLVLSAHGIINRSDAITSHPSVRDQLLDYDYREESVVAGEKITTSRGAGTAIPFALSLIGRFIDKNTAERVASEIVYEQP